MGSFHKNIQLMLEFLKALFLVHHFSYYMLITFLIMWFNSAIYADETALYFMCDKASDLWQQLELASQLESDVGDTVDWGRKLVLISMLEKLSWFYLTGLITLVLLM